MLRQVSALLDPVPARRSRIMRAVRSTDTRPELLVRRLLHRLGYRYRLHFPALPGKPDIVFTRRRKVIFVHGCFWHGHDCPRGRREPKRNAIYWRTKIEGNVRRFERQKNQLHQEGWAVMTLWECELKEIDRCTDLLLRYLGPCRVPSRLGSAAQEAPNPACENSEI